MGPTKEENRCPSTRTLQHIGHRDGLVAEPIRHFLRSDGEFPARTVRSGNRNAVA
jgi:hypothetical protein